MVRNWFEPIPLPAQRSGRQVEMRSRSSDCAILSSRHAQPPAGLSIFAQPAAYQLGRLQTRIGRDPQLERKTATAMLCGPAYMPPFALVTPGEVFDITGRKFA